MRISPSKDRARLESLGYEVEYVSGYDRAPVDSESYLLLPFDIASDISLLRVYASELDALFANGRGTLTPRILIYKHSGSMSYVVRVAASTN